MTISLRALVFTALYVLCPLVAHSQGAYPDTTRNDSLQAQLDSLARGFTRPIPYVGSIDREPVIPVITDSLINFKDYRYLGDLLRYTPGVFIREFGTPGRWHDLTMQGLGEREILFMQDGIGLNDPYTGLFNAYLLPTENIARIEMITGPRAYLYGLNSTGGTVNVVTKSKKALRPYSRLRYSESDYGFSIVDGMVSQDIIRGLNTTLGVQHHTFGNRFPNDGYDHWNGRIKIRYNLSNSFNVFASGMYNQTQLGLNGGIDLLATPDSVRFERILATVRNRDAYEKITRNDFQVGVAANFVEDSSSISSLTVYSTENLREYRDEENRETPNGIFLQQNQRTQWMGIKLMHHQTLGAQTFDLGAEIQSQRSLVTPLTNESRATLASVYGISTLEPLRFFRVSPSARLESYKGLGRLSYGLDGTLDVTRCINFFGGYSRSYRFPTFQERMGTDPAVTSNLGDDEPERHHILEAGFGWSYGDLLTFRAKVFHRTIWNLIAIDPVGPSGSAFTRHQKEVDQGVNGNFSSRLGSFFAEGNVQYLEKTDHEESYQNFPRWVGEGGVYFWDELFDMHLELKSGVRVRGFGTFHTTGFNEQAIVFLPNDQPFEIPATGVLDVVIIAHLGDAYLHFVWNNLLDRKYVMTSFYPMLERTLRFGVSWEFIN